MRKTIRDWWHDIDGEDKVVRLIVILCSIALMLFLYFSILTIWEDAGYGLDAGFGLNAGFDIDAGSIPIGPVLTYNEPVERFYRLP